MMQLTLEHMKPQPSENCAHHFVIMSNCTERPVTADPVQLPATCRLCGEERTYLAAPAVKQGSLTRAQRHSEAIGTIFTGAQTARRFQAARE